MTDQRAPMSIQSSLKQASNRVTAQSLSQMAKALGRCGDVNPITGYVCVTQPHSDEDDHMSMFIGGPRDGQVTSTWSAKGFDSLSGPTDGRLLKDV